ncbi:MAG: rhomboid family intramembrane serine protease [Planctomycetota bacterium]
MRKEWYRDEPGQRFRVPPLRTWMGANLLMASLAAIYLLQLLFAGFTDWFALHVNQVGNPLCWYQFLTYALLHSEFDPWHLLLNCLMFFMFGRAIEPDLGGRTPFLIFCGVSAVVASLCFVVVEALGQGLGSGTILLGASGMAYACMVAFATLRPHALMIFSIRAWVMVSIFMGLAVFHSLTSGGDGVAHVAHLGGGAFGFLFIRYRFQASLVWERYQQHLAQAGHSRKIDRKQEVDRILEKISESGIGSLTKEERKFLESASRDLRNPR